jgi:hypothetical protein
MKIPVWFEKSKGGFFYKPVHWAGWLVYIMSFADITASFYMLSEKNMKPADLLKAVLPILVLNFFIVAVIIFITSPKSKKEKE